MTEVPRKIDVAALDLAGARIEQVEVGRIAPNPLQPRREFGPEEIAALAASMAENGLLQPLVVRPAPEEGRYELVSGERRLRAARRLGWNRVPCVVRVVDDRTLLVLALVENIQRAALTPLEEAGGYERLRDEFGLTQAEIAQVMGKTPSVVSNKLRLLSLPNSVKRYLSEGKLTEGHVLPLASMSHPGRVIDIARRAAEEGWTVQQVQDRVRPLKRDQPREKGGRPLRAQPDPIMQAIQRSLAEAFSTRVEIKKRKRGGEIVIAYGNNADFERLFEALTGEDLTSVVD